MDFKRITPTVVCRQSYLPLAILILALCLLFPMISQAAGVPLKTLKNENGAQVQIPQGLSVDEVDTYLAGLSDEQARQVLSLNLKEAAANNPTSATTGDAPLEEDAASTLFYDVALGASLVMDQIGSFFSDDQGKSLKWDPILSRLSDGRGIGRLLLTVFLGVVVLACGFIVERQVVRLSGNLRQQILSTVALGKLQRLGRFISRLLLDAIGVGAFILTTFILFILIFHQEEAGYWIVSSFLISAYYLVIIMFAARVVLSPAVPALRLLPLQDQDAKFLHRWIVRITIIAAVLVTPSLIFMNVGRSEELANLFYIATGLSVIIAMIVMIWQSRQRVAEAICADTSEGICEENSLRMKFGRIWHYIAILYVIGSGMFWLINVFLGTKDNIVNLIAILFLIPIFIGLDQWVQRLLKMASGELPEVINLNGEETAPPTEAPAEDQKTGIKHFAPLIRKVFRIVLAALLFFIVLGLWGIDIPIGRIFAADALKIIMILILGFVIWEFTKSRIDRKLKEEMPDDDEEMEEGGAGGSRIGTLLMLLRKFILAIMVIMVSLIVLSSLGVNIGPLIAGAGVVGLAIGFGAQTLVKDIIAGVFFLMDDAFRVGDFIETSGTKGSVEHISLRSLRLRNARGPIHTIPFGSMGTVTNMSRDYIITKLDFRVRYDTDVDKVRKIIKKINKKIIKDPEMGPNLLDKIKSQGVRELDDSAMIMRLKFKSIPGEQFVIRREVFRMIQESFRDNGIEFAHRNVTVYLPPEDKDAKTGDEPQGGTPGGRPDKKLAEAAAAAGAAAIQAEEDAQKKTEA